MIVEPANDSPLNSALTPIPAHDEVQTAIAAPKPLVWPEWFRHFDMALAILAVVLAFGMASFTAKNPDLWRHLASGRLIATGQYAWGKDALTFAAPERPWVNPNWLAEAVFYAIYSVDSSGAILVTIKAMAYAAAIGVLFLLRKPKFSLWPWFFAALLGGIAAGSFTQLRPFVFGLLLQAVTLAAIYRGNWTEKKWKMPLIYGGLVALWANVDGFAFLGVLSIGLIALGEFLHGHIFRGYAEIPASENPGRDAPPAPALLRGLACAAVGLLLNPTFLLGLAVNPAEALAQLVPYELDFFEVSAALTPDKDLATATWSFLKSDYMANANLGLNAAGIAAIVVWVLGSIAAGVNFRQARVSQLLLWIAYALLAMLVHARFAAFSMIVGIPFLAIQLTALFRMLESLPSRNPRLGPVLMIGARLGRVLSLLAVIVLIVLIIPGKLHPQTPTPGLQRNLAWGVEPDEGMKRAGELLKGWRADPEKAEVWNELRGLQTHTDIGDYFAWYAPEQKVWLNSRYRYHRAELPDLVAIRKRLLTLNGESDADDTLAVIVEKRRADCIFLGRAFGRLNTEVIGLAQSEFTPAKANSPRFGGVLWHVDGRFAIVGRGDATGRIANHERLRWDVSKLAFAPQSPASRAKSEIEPGNRPVLGWLADLLMIRSKPDPIEMDDAMSYATYAASVRIALDDQHRYRLRFFHGGLQLMGGIPMAIQAEYSRLYPANEARDDEYALPILAARASRSAAESRPENAGSHQILADVYKMKFRPDTTMPLASGPYASPFVPSDSSVQVLVALNRAAARLPDPNDPNGGPIRGALAIRVQLIEQYFQLNQIDQAYAVANDLRILADRAATKDELADLAFIPIGPLWAEVLRIAVREFRDFEMRLLTQRGLRPRSWEPKLAEFQSRMSKMIEQNGGPLPQEMFDSISAQFFFDFMVERQFFQKADDPSKWLEKAMERNAAHDPSLIKQRLPGLVDALREVVRKRIDRAETATKGLKPDALFRQYVVEGLTANALKMVIDDDSGQKKDIQIDAPEVLRLMLWTGQLEQCHTNRIDQQEKFEKASDGSARAAIARAKYRWIEFEEAKLSGDFARADLLYEEILRTPLAPSQNPNDLMFFPELGRGVLLKPLTESELAAIKIFPNRETVNSFGAFGGSTLAGFFGTVGEEPRLRLYFQAMTRFQRGVWMLEAGDTIKAREHFEAAANPQGIPLEKLSLPPEFQDSLGGYLKKYRGLLKDHAEKAAPGKGR